MHRRAVPPAILLVLLLGVMSAGSVTAADPPPYPDRMAATGDSITRAFNTCFFPFTDCPANSWSTGTSSTVNSHYPRLRTLNAAIDGHNYNRAVSGARIADLDTQMQNVNAIGGIEYVTVLMGGNDLCTDTTALMTSGLTFETQLRDGLAVLRNSGSTALVYLVSIPDVYNLWAILKDNSSARSTWDAYDVCQSLLANPLSTHPDDVARRELVRQRNLDFNAIIASVCAGDLNCVTDGGRVFDTKFAAADVSTRDYFHPSIEGLRKLAEVSWVAGPWGGVVATAHAGDLDGAAARAKRGWQATVTITVHGEAEASLSGAAVSGSWGNGSAGSCTTGGSGTCTVSVTLGRNVTSTSFTVTGIAASGRSYDAAANHDPDGDSNGTSITLIRP